MTVELTYKEIEMVYMALNDYSMKYERASHTLPNGRDHAERKSKEIEGLRERVGSLFLETK